MQQVYEPISDQAIKQLLESGAIHDIDIDSRSLAAALADQRFVRDGQLLHAYTDGNLDGIGVRLNNQEAPLIYFSRINPIPLRFTRFYLTSPAQTGRTLYLTTFRNITLPISNVQAEITTTLEQRFYTISSARATHFAGAIAQAAKEDESLTGLLDDRIYIKSVSIISTQKLDLYLLFYNTDTTDDANVDTDSMCGQVHLDLITHAVRLGTGLYYMTSEALDLEYVDEDATKELHVSLYNASPTAKIAGASGYLKIDVKYELRQ